MKLFLVLASLVAVSLAAPSVDSRLVEERLLREVVDEAADVKRSPADVAELLELRKLELRINAMLDEEEIMNHKAKAGLGALEDLDSIYKLEQELEQPKRFQEPSLSPEQRLLLEKRSHQLTPLQQLALLKEEKMLELEKDKNLLRHKENQMGPLELLKEEKMLDLEKEEKILEYKRNRLTPLEQLELIRKQKMLELEKEKNLLEYKEGHMGPLELFKEEKMLELEKEEKLLDYRRSRLTPLEQLTLLKREKMLELEKEKNILEHKDSNMGPLEEKRLELEKEERLLNYKRSRLSPLEQLTLLKEEKMLELEKERDILKHKDSRLGPLEEKKLELDKEERLLDYKRSRLTPLEQLTLLKEEKMLELEKEKHLLEHKESHLGPLHLIEYEKMLELNKDEKKLDYERNNLSPSEQLLLLKREKMLELQKERDILSRQGSQLTPLEQLKLEKMLELNKEEKMLEYRRNQLTPLEQLGLLKEEKMLDLKKEEDLLEHKGKDLTPMQQLMLLKEEKMLALEKEMDLLKHKQSSLPMSPKEELLEKLFPGLQSLSGRDIYKLELLEKFPALALLTLSLDKLEQSLSTEMRQLTVDELLIMHRHLDTTDESLRRIRFMMLLQLLNIDMPPMPESEMLVPELFALMLKRNKAQEEMDWQRQVDLLLVRYRTGKASLEETLVDYRQDEMAMNSRPVLNVFESIAEKMVHHDIMSLLRNSSSNSSTSDNETHSFLRDMEFLRLVENEQLGELWNLYKLQFKKNHFPEVENFRREIFKDKVRIIVHHNIAAKLGKHSFTMAINNFTDWTEEELAKLRGLVTPKETTEESTGRRVRRQTTSMPTYRNTVDVSTLPLTVNWTAQGWVGPVLDQGECGSCWSFAAAGALGAQYFNKTQTFIALSEQNLIDCSSSYGNDGCDGGAFQYAFDYVLNVGIDAAISYPYTGTNGTCQYSVSDSVTNDNGWWNVMKGSELALQQAVALTGPVAVGIDAGLTSFQYYRSGVYAESACTAANIDHAVLVVGYGTTSTGQDYWLIKNSWGTSWGMDGYMMMARNDGNMCGIASDAAMPVIN